MDIVSDPKQTSGTTEIVNGLSCMACHAVGLIDSVLDEVRTGHAVSGEARRKVRQLYPPRTQLLALLEEDNRQFQTSLKKAIGPYLSSAEQDSPLERIEEPIGELMRLYYNTDLTLETAACELGYDKPDVLRGAIQGNETLREIGLRTLVSGGSLKRESWEQIEGQSLFQKAARHLGIGSPRKVR